ncbi:MAG TPA: protein-S-isoprenylcysteine O-methyltransferase [Xanthobacteraceae bacterium]|nr:protein-S-isoprenylcysteine O-methyltransferase [Xanthobacteraceae bacterium]
MTPTLAKIIWLVFAVGWALLRLNPNRRARKTAVRYSGRDVREFLLLAVSLTGLGIVPCLYVAAHVPRFADYPFSPVASYLGVAADIAAIWLFYRTHRDLGHNWSVSLDLRESHTLVTTGIYGTVRHPMYAGFWLMALAQVLLLPNWVAGPAGLVGFGVLFFGRIGREEEMMISAFGEEYRAYMRRTARVLPWFY